MVQRHIRGIVLAVGCVAAALTPAEAQVVLKAAPGTDAGDGLSARKLFVTDRQMTLRLTRAQELVAAEKYRDAITLLQRILDSPEDFHYSPDRDDRSHLRGLKQEALRTIAELPEDGRETYELVSGATAQALVDDGRKTHNVALLEEAARRFFHTEAGYEATWLLGNHHLDRSSPLAAAQYFDRLRQMPEVARQWEPMLTLKTAVCWGRAHMPEQSIETLMAFRDSIPGDRIEIGGRLVPLFKQRQDALPWLVQTLGQEPGFAQLARERWTMFRGDSTRNASSPQATPTWQPAWVRDTLDRAENDDPNLAESIRTPLNELQGELRNQGWLNVPVVHPLAIGDRIVFRTLANLRAVDLKSGELLWESAILDPAYEQILEQSTASRSTAAAPGQQSPLAMYLNQRAWRDLTFGTISTDGDRVYSLEDLGFVGPFQTNPRAPQHPLAPQHFNKLMAFELASGKLRWEIGGPSGDFALDAADTFFLGAPLPIGDQLFVLGETNGEISLFVLDPQTGAPLWKQLLVNPQMSVDRYPARRQAGISPSFGEGVMVCPTTAGAVVGVDVARRMLLWGYRYQTTADNSPLDARARMMMRMMNSNMVSEADHEDRWLDHVPTLAEGRVLLTPRDSDSLHCLNLVDGEPLWTIPRGQGLYLAGVFEGKAIVVGRSHIAAYDLATGDLAWKEVTPIPMPAGRGLRSGPHYRLPLTTGEIATIDLNTGRILARSQSADGKVPGNLVAVGGAMISQSVDSLFAFQPFGKLEADLARTLEADPDNAAALTRRGEIRLHTGEEEAGLKDLRRALEIESEPRAGAMVVATLLEGLRYDFAKYQKFTPEIEELVRDPRQKSRYLRLHAAGLHEVGRQDEAFAEYLKLAGPGTGEPELQRMNSTLTVRSDRWVRPRARTIFEEAGAEQRAKLELLIREQLDQAVQNEDPRPLRRFVTMFSGLPLADEARRELVERLDPAQDGLEIELLLHRLQDSADVETAGFATAHLASMLIALERFQDALPHLEALATRFADVPCLGEQTGDALAAAWRSDEEIQDAMAAHAGWPDREIEAEEKQQNGGAERTYPVDVIGSPGPYYRGWLFQLDQRRQNLFAYDGAGVRQWSLSLTANGGSVPNVYANHVRIHGHLLVVVLGNRFIVLDGLAAGDRPRQLWHRDLFESVPGPNRNRGVNIQQVVLPGGARRIVVLDQYRRPLGEVGPITDEFICYQSGKTVYAADPLTGRTLWERHNISRGGKLFGDQETVLVVRNGTNQAEALRAADGHSLGVRRVVGDTARLATIGRHELSWIVQNQRSHLSRTDVLTGETVWTTDFSERAKMTVIEDEEVAVLEPTGEFAVIRVSDGKELLSAKLESDESLSRIIVLRSNQHYTLLTESTGGNNNVRAIGVGFNNPIVNGFAYGFDRVEGKELWRRKIERQSIEPNQPLNLPTLVFTVRTYTLFRGGRPFNRNEYHLAILDKRNGRMIHTNRGTRAVAPFQVVVDPQQNNINVKFPQAVVEMKLTDRPLPEPEIVAAGAEPADEPEPVKE